MRFTCILLLVATALLARVDAASKTSLLRFNEDQHIEERAITAGKLLKQATRAQFVKAMDSVRVPIWLQKGKSADNIFNRLKLNNGVDKVLDNKNLATWFTYVKAYNLKYPDKQISLTGMMSKTYGDDAVVRMLEIARDNPYKNGVADDLLWDIKATWAQGNKRSNDVFAMLNLQKEGDNLFSRRELHTWIDYTKAMNQRDPDSYVVNILTQRLGDDKLAMTFATARPQDPELKILAVKLQTTMVKEWKRDGFSVDEVFKVLKLDEGAEKVFANPTLETWMGYVSLLRGRDDQLDTMMKTFTTVYSIEAVARMLQAAKKMENTSKLATNLQMAQFKLWRRGFRKPEAVAKIFNSKDEADDAIIRAYSEFYKT